MDGEKDIRYYCRAGKHWHCPFSLACECECHDDTTFRMRTW